MKHTYEVPIVYKGQINSIIEYEEIDRIGDIDKID